MNARTYLNVGGYYLLAGVVLIAAATLSYSREDSLVLGIVLAVSAVCFAVAAYVSSARYLREQDAERDERMAAAEAERLEEWPSLDAFHRSFRSDVEDYA